MPFTPGFLCAFLAVAGGAQALLPQAPTPVLPQGDPSRVTPLVPRASGQVLVLERQHGKLAWFEGTFEELLAEAARTKRVVFIDFWTEWCPYCAKLEKVTFQSDSVAAELRDVLCYSVDANKKAGRVLARKFQARGYPTLAFLDPDGTLRDQLSGYLAPEVFVAEVRRIKKNEGTLSSLRERIGADPGDLETRWQLAKKLKYLGDLPGYEEQVFEIRDRDPEGKSPASRRLRLDELRAQAEKSLKLEPLYEFVAREQDAEMLFEGWLHIWTLEGQAMRTQRDPEGAREHELRWLAAARSLWPLVPPEKHGQVGNEIAWYIYESRLKVTRADLEFALSVAEKAVQAEPDMAFIVDTHACCLYALGRRDEALRQVRRCIELDPRNSQWKERLAEFQGQR